MKTTILLFALLFSLISCNGSGGSSGPGTLDPRLSDGSGTWTITYTITSIQYHETLHFFNDGTATYRIERVGLPGLNVISDDTHTYNLVPVTNSSLVATNVSDSSDTYGWSYSFSGTTMNICDGTDCSTFNKQ